jgi:molecular chaperone DnaK
MNKVIGIDLGTTNSVVATMEGGKPKVITNEEGSRTTPSIVAYTKNDEILIGQSARRQAVTNPENTIFSAKRFIGQRFSDCKEIMKSYPFNCAVNNNDMIVFNVRGKTISPQEVSAKILQKLKKSAETYLGQTVSKAVITVPAYFNDSQRQATKDAGKIAGLNVERIVNEPTAASLAYGIDKKKDEKIAVFDLGGGTFDISILEVCENVVEVKSTNGDTNLGGDDFDLLLIKYLVLEFKKEHQMDIGNDKVVLQRLKDAAEKAKIELSNILETEINLPFLTVDSMGPKHLNVRLTRSKFTQIIKNTAEKSLVACRKVMSDAKLSITEIDEVILVGGSTRIPLIQDIVENFFQKKPNKSVNPDEVVALGAAVQGGVLSGEVKDMLLLDVTPLSLGIETLGGVFTVLIPRNTTIPHKKTEIFSTATDNQSSVEVHVLQGERDMAVNNRTLGRFQLEGIPLASRGVPQIEVTFDIDANGIVNVSAKDRGTNKEQKITITTGSTLTDEEVNRMVKEAQKHTETDKKNRKLVEERNKLDGLIYAVKKTFNENKEKVSSAEQKTIEEAIKNAEEKVSSKNLNDIIKSHDELTKISHKFTDILYKNTKSNPANKQESQKSEENHDKKNTDSNTKENDVKENIVDADFKEKK